MDGDLQTSSSLALYHTGVLGMRWHIHKAHDKYGGLTKTGSKQSELLKQEHDRLSSISTLTPKGVARKKEVADEYKKLTGKSIVTKTKKVAEDKKEDPISKMSNEEIQAANARATLENQYRNLQPKTPVSYHGKKLSEMSNAELSAYNERKKLEKDFIGYQPKPEVSKGKQFVNTAMTKVIGPALIDAGKAYMTDMLKKQLKVSNNKPKVTINPNVKKTGAKSGSKMKPSLITALSAK